MKSDAVDLVYLHDFSERYKAGWRLIEGYELRAGDYVATMIAPGCRPPLMNTHKAAVSRNEVRYGKDKPKPTDELQEEIRQLRDKIAQMEGKDIRYEARNKFGLTEDEAIVFAILYQRRKAETSHLIDAVYGDEVRATEPIKAIRSHVKRARRKLRKHGVDFSTLYGFGYAMDDKAHKAASMLMRGGA